MSLCEREKGPGNKVIDEGIRVRFENFKEGEHVTQERPTHVTRWERVLHLSQPANIVPLIHSPKDPKHKCISTQQSCY